MSLSFYRFSKHLLFLFVLYWFSWLQPLHYSVSVAKFCSQFRYCFSLVWGCILVYLGRRSGNFGGQLVAKMESKSMLETVSRRGVKTNETGKGGGW